MILIADSGATKSDWVLMGEDMSNQTFELVGLNPYYVDSAQIETVINKELVPVIENEKVEKVYFYGAGCSTVYKSMVIEEALAKPFKNAEIIVNSDLLGAARALFWNEEGIACILGTGSNSCYFDGIKIVKNVPSLGYFFGDEGSGAHMGKTFIKDYLLGNLPKEIDKAFRKEYNYTRENILDAIYNLPFPNRFLASFNSFYADNLSNKYIFVLVADSFREFFINQIEHYENYRRLPVSFVGSVAFYFEALLRQVATEFDINVEKISRTPIEALAKYHKL